jgi:fermentation-respiration switch protein FrsA (DUF1100 family)
MATWRRRALFYLAGYVGLVLMLLFFENRLVFVPTTAAQHWQPAPSPDIQDVELTCADGTRIHAWWCPCPDSDEAVLICHGNAGNLSHRGDTVVRLRDILRASVLIFDYPGYGKSDGSPTEQGCYQSADAGYAWLIGEKKFASKKILLYGESLGGGVSVDLASRKDHRALVLIKTFTSVPDVACDIYWWLPMPIRPLMSNRFDNISKMSSCRRPVFIGHGMTDELIPYEHGQKLFQAANEPKEFFAIADGGGHNEKIPVAFFTTLKDFLRRHPVD